MGGDGDAGGGDPGDGGEADPEAAFRRKRRNTRDSTMIQVKKVKSENVFP